MNLSFTTKIPKYLYLPSFTFFNDICIFSFTLLPIFIFSPYYHLSYHRKSTTSLIHPRLRPTSRLTTLVRERKRERGREGQREESKKKKIFLVLVRWSFYHLLFRMTVVMHISLNLFFLELISFPLLLQKSSPRWISNFPGVDLLPSLLLLTPRFHLLTFLFLWCTYTTCFLSLSSIYWLETSILMSLLSSL